MDNLQSHNGFLQSDLQIRPYAVAIDYTSDVSAFIHHLSHELNVEELKDKTAFLMISIKNKAFSNRLIEAFIDFVDKFFEYGFITIVDKPYIHNVNALYDDPEKICAEVSKLEKIKTENQARVKRILNKKACEKIKQVSWDTLELNTPEWAVAEVETAFSAKGLLYQDILNRTLEVIPAGVINDQNIEKYAQFLVKEIPVLLHQYYFSDDRIVDVYPGENPSFLWKVEAGHYVNELPRISEAAIEGKGLTYIDFQINK